MTEPKGIDMALDPSPLVGEAIGDALGKAFETKPVDDYDLLHWKGEFLPSEYHKLGAFQWTDDTMMAKLLAESLMFCGGYYPKDVADRYLAWWKGGDHRGMGKTTAAALKTLSRDGDWSTSGVSESSGNGTAMRAAPLGFYYREDIRTAVEFAKMDARITHDSIEAECGSAAVVTGIALLAKGTVNKKDLIVEVGGNIPYSKITKILEHVRQYQAQGMDLDHILNLLGNQPLVFLTVPAAFAIFTMTSSFVEAVEAAVRAGGDTDTVAAITGALAGTFYGHEAIPSYYKKNLEDYEVLRRVEKHLAKGPRTDILWAIDRSPIPQPLSYP